MTREQMLETGRISSLKLFLFLSSWGKLIDSRGPRIPLLCAFFLQFIGYNGIRMFYQGSLRMLPSGSVVNEAEAVKGTAVGISGLGIVMMMCFMCMTGCGACAGLNSSMVSAFSRC